MKFSEGLYLGGFDDILSAVAELDDSVQTVLWVGHNPGVSEVASSLSLKPHGFQPAELLVLENEINDWVEALCSSNWKQIRKFSPIS